MWASRLLRKGHCVGAAREPALHWEGRGQPEPKAHTQPRKLDLMLNDTMLPFLKNEYFVHPKPLLRPSPLGPSSLGRGVTPGMGQEANLVAHTYRFLSDE